MSTTADTRRKLKRSPTGRWLLDHNRTQRWLAEKAKVGVYNGSAVSGLAGTTRDYLTTLGVNVVEVGNADYVSMTTIYDYTGNPYTVQYLVNLLGINSTRIFSSYDPNSEIDVSIVLGNDWSVP